MIRATFLLIVIAVMACNEPSSGIPAVNAQDFSNYWYRGEAEISSFTLQQSRYGEMRDGEVIIVFVTEDMDEMKQVKMEGPKAGLPNAIKVLKMNMANEFVTGIYKYNMMTSVFTPADYHKHPHSLKLTSSSQDWCGQTFMQANYRGTRYEFQTFSYFGNEGDQNFNITSTWLEDEIWNKIRLAPNTLPLGKTQFVPSAFFLRLSHAHFKSYEVQASLLKETERFTYIIDYPELKRKLSISFQPVFPHRILGWTESIDNRTETSATLLNTMMNDYWNHNTSSDEVIRTELKLK